MDFQECTTTEQNLNTGMPKEKNKRFAYIYKIHHPGKKILAMRADYAIKLPKEKASIIRIFLNDLNNRMLPCHFSFCDKCGILSLHTSFYVPGTPYKKDEKGRDDEALTNFVREMEHWFPSIPQIVANKSLDLYFEYLEKYYEKADR